MVALHGNFSFYNSRAASPKRTILPKGTSAVHRVLLAAADGLVKGGEQGIFTPMLFFLAKKGEVA